MIIVRTMASRGQMKISSFFGDKKSMNTARSCDSDRAEEPDEKRQKLGDMLSPTRNGTNDEFESTKLSPNLKTEIEKKRLQAKVLRLSKELPALHNNFGLSWFKALEPEFSKPYFKKLSTFLASERQKGVVFPPSDLVFTWTKLCAIEQVKVVILGQDPYHNIGQAHGLSFSVPKGIKPPPSLVNMFIELESDIPGFQKPQHGDLTGWAKQGVLLLNACLTVRAHQANSHKDQGWEQLTDAVISWINKNSQNVVFILWGAYAHKKQAMINMSQHCVLKAVHPSPLSVRKGFFGCKHFSLANKYLEQNARSPINWSDLPVSDK